MVTLIIVVISAILVGSLAYANTLLDGIVSQALYIETLFSGITGIGDITRINDIIVELGISLIILKFLRKGFGRYVLWTDGDADTDPFLLLTGFFKALAVATCFPVIYKFLANLLETYSQKLIETIGETANEGGLQGAVDELASASLFTAIASLVFFIFLFIIYINILKHGLEMLYLRMGISLACVGFMDRDDGAFRTYVQKIIQGLFGVGLQVFSAKLGLAVLLTGHPLIGIACMTMALSAPKFLQEFVQVSGNDGGGMINKAYSTARMYEMGKRMVAK